MTGRGRLTRRGFLAASGAGAAGLALAACGTGSSTSEKDEASPDGTVDWSNWIAYIDIDDDTGARPSLERAQSELGITVNYVEDINDNNEFLAKVRPTLEQGRSIGRDMVVLTDWMAGLWITNGWVEELDKGNIPNAGNLIPALQSPAFDPDRKYTIPWQSGFAGLGWNTPLLQELTGKTSLSSVDELWAPELKGRVSVLSEMRDTIGVIMLWQGNDPANFTDDQYDQALAELQKQVDSGQIRQVQGNDYLTSLEGGDVIAVIGWSGDVVSLGDDFGFALPESGGTLWTDNIMIPQVAGDKADAEKLINFYMDPANAAEVAAYVNYLTPIAGTQEAMQQLDPELAESEWIFPSDEKLSEATIFQPLDEETDAKYQAEFQAVIGN